MQFRSTHVYEAFTKEGKEPLVSFKEAVLNCLPPDGGLYVPSEAMDIRQLFLYMNETITFPELAAAVTPSLFQGEFNPFSASRVAQSAFNFEPELVRLDDDYSLLNLYNGPTGLYNDFGLAFLAAVLEELHKNTAHSLVLGAARGDTGISMAHAFGGRKGIGAVLVYPSGPICGLDPAAFAPNGGNILPIQIQGTFDDCQRLIEGTINDRTFAARYNVTSANAINPGRLLPQMFYYLYAFIKIKKQIPGGLVFSVPCGNFGNLIAGLYAWKFGMPVTGFIAAMNANNALGDFIKGGPFIPRSLINTNSPALDVSIPSNLNRLAAFYREAPAVMRNMVYPASVDDNLTLKTIEQFGNTYHVRIDSHTAVAAAAAFQTAAERNWKGNIHTVILATGHYAREAGSKMFQSFRKKNDPVAVIPPDLETFKGVIASCF
jgi:threonine synthase